MPVQFKIKVTKKILELSKYCGTHNDPGTIGENCAIANALKDIYPAVSVTGYHIYPFGIDKNKNDDLKIPIPSIARDFIKVFDSLSAIPNVRTLLPEFEFEISIPDEIISRINIDDVRAIAEESKSLDLVG